MFFPSLVDPKLCNTNIKVVIQSEELNRYGEPQEYEKNLNCNYQSSAKTIYTDEKKLIQLTAKAYFNGDIAPEVAEISGGYVEMNGIRREINKGFKCRNIDGTVNYTMLEIL